MPQTNGPDNSRDLGRLLDNLSPRLLAHARRMLKVEADAQDAVQEALLIAHSRLNQLRDITRFPAWIRAIVSSQCYRQLRRRAMEMPGEDFGRLEPMAPAQFDPACAYERKALHLSIERAIADLSLPLREACRLYFQAELPVSEIAEILQLQTSTVRKRIHAARSGLIKILSNETETPAIVVGYLPISDHILGMVAHRICAGDSSRICMKRFLSWEALAKALQHGTINTAFIMAPLAMQLCNSGTHLKYIMNGHRDGSALTTTTPQLKGKMVGVPGEYATHRVLLAQLVQSRPGDWDGVNTFNTNPSYVINRMRQQAIDAFFCAEPWSTRCVSEGQANVLIRSRDIAPNHLCCVVAARADFCDAHPELIQEYVQLLYQARDRLISTPDFCSKAQAEYTGVSQDLAAAVLQKGTISFEGLAPSKDEMKALMQQAIASGVLSAPCDLQSFVNTAFC